MLVTERELVAVTVDPDWETADVDVRNNHYPRQIIPSRLEAYKSKKGEDFEHKDIMHDIKTELEEPERKKKKK
jgi:hypothetical protein